MSRDLHHSQPVRTVDVLAREPDPNEERDLLAELDEHRRRAREKDELLALEVKLLGNAVRKQNEFQRKLVDLVGDIQASSDQQLEALRSIRDSVASSAQEGPQLLALILDALKQMRDSVAAIALVVLTKGTNGHSPEGETT